VYFLGANEFLSHHYANILTDSFGNQRKVLKKNLGVEFSDIQEHEYKEISLCFSELLCLLIISVEGN
jgi:hypothetical protein